MKHALQAVRIGHQGPEYVASPFSIAVAALEEEH